MAAGTATTLRQDTALCEMKDFDKNLQQVKLSILPKIGGEGKKSCRIM